jgi:hypothetical protein
MAAVTRAAIARAAMTSGTTMALGDVLFQCVNQQQQRKERAAAAAAAAASSGGKRDVRAAATATEDPSLLSGVDFRRTARFALIGATLHGPFFAAGLTYLDRLFPGAATPKIVAQKVLTGQATLFPAYTGLFLAYLRLLEGVPPGQIAARLRSEREQLAATIARGCVFWPAVNCVNFSVVPAGTPRIFCMNVAGLAWNAYLSYATSGPAPGASAGAGKRRAD